jgi:hypothetical protein
MNQKNPNSNTPQQDENDPLGDRGDGDRTWSPEQGEQGISNRVGDENPEANDDEGFDEDETNPSPA